MIRINRPPEPPALPATRDGRLAGVKAQLNSGVSVAQLNLDGYQPFRDALHEMQHRKCCYCEMRAESSFHDVEHFRPKRVYYWLTWTWENLFFACNICNRSYKGANFPLERGQRLKPGQPAPGSERPLLLDPCQDDPAAHIVFRPVLDKWIPFARAGSRRGAETIRITGLDRGELLDIYKMHVDELGDRLDLLRDAFAKRDEAQIQKEWSRFLRGPARRSAPFTALSRDVLDHHFGAVFRRRLSLELPPP